MKKEKILVALSGGVDSAVAAALLVQLGHEVTGAFMVNYETDERDGKRVGSKCWTDDYRDALRIAAKLGIPLIRLDFVKEYKKFVLDYLFHEYELGNTPNPDVLCNQYIKFGFWLKKAKQLGFSKLATGHYARISVIARSVRSERRGNPLVGELNNDPVSEYLLLEAVDKNKDQTYFLHQLTQNQLRDVLFPIGNYTKPQVRKLAKKFGLPVAEKEESMGICFVGEVPMKEFLEKKIKAKPGKVVRTDGEIIGEHDGLAFYTIGQRQIGITNYHGFVSLRRAGPPSLPCATDGRITNNLSRPLYVVGKKMGTNELIVGYEDDPLLHKKTIVLEKINWISGQAPKFPLKCMVRLRHRQALQECRIVPTQSGQVPIGSGQVPTESGQANLTDQVVYMTVKFGKAQRAPAPGQFAVFYKNGHCLGGGVISDK